jgi:hypothetical protein
MFFYDDATQGEIKMSNSNGNGNGNLIEALLAFASKELTSDQAAKLNNLIENNSDPRATYAKDKVAPENAERAIDLLRQKGVSESDIDKIREICGVDKPTMAQDAARRDAIRVRNKNSYARHFPDAAKITTSPY